MSMCCCNNRLSCLTAAVVGSAIVGVIAAFLTFAAIITVTPAFLWVVLGIAVGFLAVALVSSEAYSNKDASDEGDGAYLAMNEALEKAGLTPSDVRYINVHGTGTGNNDSSEGQALKRLFGENVPPFSSTKGFTGHTLAAAGGIEAVLSVLSVSKGIIWPNIHFKQMIEGLDLCPQTIYKEGEEIGCVISNSFGFGGNCSSLVFVK